MGNTYVLASTHRFSGCGERAGLHRGWLPGAADEKHGKRCLVQYSFRDAAEHQLLQPCARAGRHGDRIRADLFPRVENLLCGKAAMSRSTHVLLHSSQRSTSPRGRSRRSLHPRGQRGPIHLVLVAPSRTGTILREYVRIAPTGRQHFPLLVGAPLSYFEALRSVIRCTESIPREVTAVSSRPRSAR